LNVFGHIEHGYLRICFCIFVGLSLSLTEYRRAASTGLSDAMVVIGGKDSQDRGSEEQLARRDP
jgi:hypothetical protein